ncbi:FliM/FliN family flagellar motor switch protein [Paraburkholderia azotifigens]|uniref:FliM/FliN family flagellar motor switch protein n=1 Tax=Paraburkholderia azotifigens TaxID=2057004 RepID=A0A5C6VRZ0_9BURK|nr:FliM/FliN family flagellar motor switch protein [Paraburkholderia azotifigens]TXC86178.1 type III secretion protein [Paraburkholderia azotifigens]
MSPWQDMERVTLAHAKRHNVAALHFGTPYSVSVGKRAFSLQFEPCRARYPLRMHARAMGEPMSLDCDVQALFPELNGQALTQAQEKAPQLIAEALDEWLSALEGAFGFAIDITGVSFDAAPPPGAYGLVLTHARSHRTAHFALDSPAVDQWLAHRAVPAAQMAGLGSRLSVRVPVCMAGPALSMQRLRKIRPGDALLVDPSHQYLRVPLRHGARRILLTQSGAHMAVDHPLIDDAGESTEMTSELIPANALTFSFDAVIGTLSFALDDLMRLRPGSIVSLQLPVRRHAVTLLCQGIPFARGELIDIDDALGVRIVDLTHLSDTRTAS